MYWYWVHLYIFDLYMNLREEWLSIRFFYFFVFDLLKPHLKICLPEIVLNSSMKIT